MTSSELAYCAKLAWQAGTGVARFKGRSRRIEFGYYWIAAAIVGFLLWLFAGSLQQQLPDALSWQQERIISKGGEFLFALPIFALFVRRLHDQDRSAWWILILPPLLAMNIYKTARFILLDPRTGAITLPDLPWWLTLAGALLALTHVVLMFMPGTDGPNRFGPDPRAEDPRAARLPSADPSLSSTP